MISLRIAISFLASSDKMKSFGFCFMHSLKYSVFFEQLGMNLRIQETIPRKPWASFSDEGRGKFFRALTLLGEGFNPSFVAIKPSISKDGLQNAHLGGCILRLLSCNRDKIFSKSFRWSSKDGLKHSMSSMYAKQFLYNNPFKMASMRWS